jgi:hypothetical protein
MTTADVVDSPTPFAPPCVVIPHEQLTPEMIAPKAVDLISRAKRSDFCSAFDAESRITFGPTSYTKSVQRRRRCKRRENVCQVSTALKA